METLKIGDVLTTDAGDRLLVVGVSATDGYRLVRIPGGMTATDHGQRYRHAPDSDDPLRAVLIGHLQEQE